MEGSGGFVVITGEGVAVFETDGADGEVEADSESGGNFDVSIEEAIWVGREGSSIDEENSLHRAGDLPGVFGIGDPPGGAADGVVPILGAEVSFGERAHGIGSAKEFTKVDGEVGTVPGWFDKAASNAQGVAAVFAQRFVVANLGCGFEEGDALISQGNSEGGVQFCEQARGGESGIVATVVSLPE